MALFGRRKRKDPTDEELLTLDEEASDVAARPEPAEGEPGVDRDWDRASDGPYDLSEWEEPQGRIDLGAVLIPGVKGMQMRLDLEQGSSGDVVGVTLVFGASQVQVQVFAAPRTLGLWDELRPEIAQSLVQAGGAAEAVDGPMGKELRARMPGRAPDGRVAFQPARFLGVDGPRWFLRAVVNGPAAANEEQMRGIYAFVRQIVVRRGDEPRPPREVIHLTPPKGFAEAVAKEVEGRRAKAEEARRQAVAKVAPQTQVLRTSDATGVAGISAAGGAPAAASPPAPSTPEPAPTDAPKAPRNPDFT